MPPYILMNAEVTVFFCVKFQMARKSKGIYCKYDRQTIKNAVDAVRTGAMTLRQAAGTFNVPKSTINDRLLSKVSMDAKPGRPPVVPMEVEEKVVEAVTTAASCGLGTTRKGLLIKTGRLCQKLGIKTPFKDGIPGKGYFEGLKKRHASITIRKPEKLGISRARMLNQSVTKVHGRPWLHCYQARP